MGKVLDKAKDKVGSVASKAKSRITNYKNVIQSKYAEGFNEGLKSLDKAKEPIGSNIAATIGFNRGRTAKKKHLKSMATLEKSKKQVVTTNNNKLKKA